MRSIIQVNLLISFILCGCNTADTETASQIRGSGEFIHLNTAGPVTPKTKYLTYYEENRESWLFYGNEDVNELIIFELPSGEIAKRITFEYRGPSGIGRYKGALVRNFDSIFVISGTYYQCECTFHPGGWWSTYHNLSEIDEVLETYCENGEGVCQEL